MIEPLTATLLLHANVDKIWNVTVTHKLPPDDLILSPHVRSRMHQRGITEEDVRHVASRGASAPDAAPAGAPPRTRTSGVRNGRRITVIIAHEPNRRVVITVFST